MKRLCAALLLCAAPLLRGAELADVTLYFAPAAGGSAEEREFFDAKLPLEIKNPYYRVVGSEEEADFLVSVKVDTREDNAHFSHLTLGLTTAATETPVLELTWLYADKEEMYGWDIGGVLAGPVDPGTAAAASREQPGVPERTRRLYLGARGGASLTGHSFQTTPAYNAGRSLGLSAEGGLTAELRVLRFLSVQIEADVLYEAFDAPRMTATGNIRTRSTDTFSSVSLLFPVLAKAPLPLGSGRFTLSLYGGAYYLLSPWGAERTASGKTERVAGRTDPPFGIVAGADLGFRAGPGELVADLRYGNHLGTTELGDDGIDSQHIGNRINLSVGYRLGVK